MWRYFSHGWIRAYWIDPVFHFTYPGFGWVEPWPGVGMYLHFIALGILATFVALGLFYRVSVALFCLVFTYVFLLDQTFYLNHFYLIALISFLMIFVPANRVFSLDAWWKSRSSGAAGSSNSGTVPAWGLWILCFQMGVVYFFGGIAKLNGDWFRGEPMTLWLTPYARAFSVSEQWLGYIFSYGGLLFDLLIVPLLLWRKTREAAFLLAVGFHVANAGLFPIGVFPWFAIASTTLFLDPSWPRDAIRSLSRRSEEPEEDPAESAPERRVAPSRGFGGLGTQRKVIVGLLAVFVAVQVLVPLRHFLYPGNVNWSNEGSRFAWHMMIRDTYVEEAVFRVENPDNGASFEVDPGYFLTDVQALRITFYPDMVLRTAHQMSDDLRAQGFEDVEIHAELDVSLNGREPQPLVDPRMDLAAQPVSLAPAPWILPLEEPLEVQAQRPE